MLDGNLILPHHKFCRHTSLSESSVKMHISTHFLIQLTLISISQAIRLQVLQYIHSRLSQTNEKIEPQRDDSLGVTNVTFNTFFTQLIEVVSSSILSLSS